MNASTLRCVAVWFATTGLATAVLWWSLGAPPRTGDELSDLVARAAGAALAACAAWAWTVTTVVLAGEVRAARRGGEVRAPGVPGWARRAVLAACGLALVGAAPAVAAPVTATPDPGVVAGLPLPDRPTGPAHGRAERPAAANRTPSVGWTADTARTPPVVVRRDDTLWGLAAALLDAGGRGEATAEEVAALSRCLFELNRSVIGADPDLIRPGQRLRTPPGVRPSAQ